MTNLFWRVLAATALLFAGCASSQSDKAIEQSSVKIIPTSHKGCKKIGDLALTSSSTRQLNRAVRQRAAAKGATHVQLTVMEVGSNSKKIRAFGVMLICPSRPAGTDHSEDMDSDLASNKMDENLHKEIRKQTDKEIDKEIDMEVEEEKEEEGLIPYQYKPEEEDGALP